MKIGDFFLILLGVSAVALGLDLSNDHYPYWARKIPSVLGAFSLGGGLHLYGEAIKREVMDTLKGG
jgi:hypothetical protein